MLIVSGITGAPLRYRGYLPQEALAAVGVHADLHMYRDAMVPRRARAADAVVLYRVPATEQILDLVEMIRTRPDPVPVLFDVDDLIFDPGLRPELDPMLTKVPGLDLDLYWQGIRRYRTTLEAADAYIGSTEMLCDQVTELTGMPTHRFFNGVGRQSPGPPTSSCTDRASPARCASGTSPAPIRTTRIGPSSSRPSPRCSVSDRTPSCGSVACWTTPTVLAPFSGRIRRLPLKPWHQLPAVLRDLDINLAPLEPGKTFNEAKSAIKWLEAALTRTPTVASPSLPFREAIEHGTRACWPRPSTTGGTCCSTDRRRAAPRIGSGTPHGSRPC